MEEEDGLLDYIVRKSFTAGEEWGVTYSARFTPTKADTEKEIKKIMQMMERYLKRIKS